MKKNIGIFQSIKFDSLRPRCHAPPSLEQKTIIIINVEENPIYEWKIVDKNVSL